MKRSDSLKRKFAIAREMIANPDITQVEIGRKYGVSTKIVRRILFYFGFIRNKGLTYEDVVYAKIASNRKRNEDVGLILCPAVNKEDFYNYMECYLKRDLL